MLLSYTAAYQQYSTIFESRIEKFLSAHSSTESEFLECCQTALSTTETDETEFVEYILATLEYQAFLELIRREKIKELMQMVRTLQLENTALLQQKENAEAKAEAKADGDEVKGSGAKAEVAEEKGSVDSAGEAESKSLRK
jgi:hypothetical protein